MRITVSPGVKADLSKVEWAQTGPKSEVARNLAIGLLNTIHCAFDALHELAADSGIVPHVELECSEVAPAPPVVKMAPAAIDWKPVKVKDVPKDAIPVKAD